MPIRILCPLGESQSYAWYVWVIQTKMNINFLFSKVISVKMFFWSILLPYNSLSIYSKWRDSSSAGSMLVMPPVLMLRDWVDESLRQENSCWEGARAPVWWVPEGHKLSLTSCRRAGRGQEIRPEQVWLVCISRHSWGALQLKTTELSRWGNSRSCNYVVKSRGKPAVLSLPLGTGSCHLNGIIACRLILESFWERRFLSIPRTVWRREFSSFHLLNQSFWGMDSVCSTLPKRNRNALRDDLQHWTAACQLSKARKYNQAGWWEQSLQ